MASHNESGVAQMCLYKTGPDTNYVPWRRNDYHLQLMPLGCRITPKAALSSGGNRRVEAEVRLMPVIETLV